MPYPVRSIRVHSKVECTWSMVRVEHRSFRLVHEPCARVRQSHARGPKKQSALPVTRGWRVSARISDLSLLGFCLHLAESVMATSQALEVTSHVGMIAPGAVPRARDQARD